MDILAQKGGGLVLQLFHSPHLNINSQQVHKTFLSILYLRILCEIQGKPLIQFSYFSSPLCLKVTGYREENIHSYTLMDRKVNL